MEYNWYQKIGFKAINAFGQLLRVKAVKNCENPQASYKIAKPKLKLAEEQSDLNTSDDEEAKIQRKFKKKVISSSDEEVYEEDHIHSKLKLKPFPPQPQTQNVVQRKRSFNNVNENETIYELNEDDNFNNVETGPKQTISKDDVQSREDISIIKSTFPLQNNKDLAEAEAKLQAGLEFKRNLEGDTNNVVTNIPKFSIKTNTIPQPEIRFNNNTADPANESSPLMSSEAEKYENPLP
ncbi:hypothetical protein RN001_011115 [Aquatica leii]|uniref:Uncharacterized protein n=1 Tax=Aquatica leii TaxID=1421715 RepID=A0AAN7SGH7_9COLE|nr:hypothetical protein RN001_011115 [Aquatica leii]